MADILFLIDESTSIEDVEAGGSPGAYQVLLDFVRSIIRGFDYMVNPEMIRVSIITFASDAALTYHFAEAGAEGGSAASALLSLESLEFKHQDVFTDTNVHKALALARQLGDPEAQAAWSVERTRDLAAGLDADLVYYQHDNYEDKLYTWVVPRPSNTWALCQAAVASAGSSGSRASVCESSVVTLRRFTSTVSGS